MPLYNEILEISEKMESNLNDIRELQAQNAHYREKIIRLIVDSGELHLLTPSIGKVRQIMYSRERKVKR